MNETSTPDADAIPIKNMEESRAPFVEHLRELRTRLLISLAAVATGFGIAWTWVNEIFNLLLVPLQTAAKGSHLAQMHHRGLTEPFWVLLKTGIFAGVVLAIPVILYQLWKFIAPGLYPEERKLAIPVVFISTLCFLLGGSFCYTIILPYAYEFLLGFADEITQPELMMTEYMDLTVKLLLAFGVVFEMPVVTTLLGRIGILNYKMMLSFWRYAIVLCFIVGAMLTPPDLISQVFLAAPMMALYFISVGCVWMFGPRGDQLNPPDEADPAETP